MFVTNRATTSTTAVMTYKDGVTTSEIYYYTVYDYQILNSICTYTLDPTETVATITALNSTVGMAIAYIKTTTSTVT